MPMLTSPHVRPRAHWILASFALIAAAASIVSPLGFSTAGIIREAAGGGLTLQWCVEQATMRPSSLHVRYAQPHDRADDKVVIRFALPRLAGCHRYGERSLILAQVLVTPRPKVGHPVHFRHALPAPVTLARTDKSVTRALKVATTQRSSCHLPPSSGPTPPQTQAVFVSRFHSRTGQRGDVHEFGVWTATFKRGIKEVTCS